MSHIIPYSDLLEIQQLIEQRIGLASHKQSTDALEEIILNLSDGELTPYYRALSKAPVTASIWQRLIAALTIGETYFLRDKVHFQVLRDHIFPQLIESRRAERRLTIWSMGCATGEEPYSLAITLQEVLPDADTWTLRIVGTDLNEAALKTARRSIYRDWAFRHTNHDFQQAYFDTVSSGLKIKPHIRNMVRFQQANALTDKPITQYDLVLCRNVLIYFGVDSRHRTEKMLNQSVALGGWLLLGHSELLLYETSGWLADTFPGLPIYQRGDHSSSVPPPKKIPQAIRKTLTSELPAIDISKYTNNIDSRYKKAVGAIHTEDFDLAASLARSIIHEDPNHARAHALLAATYANQGLQEDAHKHIDAALYRDPLVADAHYLRALLHLEAEHQRDAHHALVAALYCQQHHPLASFTLGNLYAKTGDLRRANHYWQNTLQALENLTNQSYVSDISQITVEQLCKLVKERLKDWE